ncbi:MAG: hypothetical protein EOO56_30200 [Hymenobacter sp.]|nr:MAG: hypothetical protein EOO56_30200 [Hymenobacter sp.]
MTPLSASAYRPNARNLATLAGHRDAVYALTGRPGSDRIFSSGADGLVVAWNTAEPAQDGELLARVDNSVYALCELPGRNLLLLGQNFQGVQAIDLQSKALAYATALPPVAIFDLVYSESRYSPDGQYLLAAGRDAHLRRYTTADYAMQDAVIAHMYTINHLSFSADSQYIATCSLDKSIKLWDAASLALLRVLDKARAAGHGTSVNKLVWPGSQQRLVSCSDDRSLAVWQVY